jgi:hypothetical protein
MHLLLSYVSCKGKKALRCFSAQKKRKKRKMQFWEKNDFELFFVPLPHGASFAQ